MSTMCIGETNRCIVLNALFVFIKTKRDLNGSLLLFQNPECILFVIDESILTHGGELAGQGTSVGANVICQFDASQRERDVAAVLLLGLH